MTRTLRPPSAPPSRPRTRPFSRLALVVAIGLAPALLPIALARGWPSGDAGLSRAAGAAPAAAPAKPPVAELVAGLDLERALEDARRLSGERPLCLGEDCRPLLNRVTGGPGLDRALGWLEAEVAGLGLSVTRRPWARAGRAGENLFARREGLVTPTEEVWYVAHVDGVDGCPGGRCPAADDNASGVVAGLELARALAARPLARSLVLMFTTGEEQDALGARAWLATAAAEDLARIRVLVNADMLGWDGNGDRVLELYHDDDPRSLPYALAMSATFGAWAPGMRPRLNPGCG